MPRSSKKTLVREGSRLMRRGGYTDCGLVELLANAGLPKGSFYHFFPSKEAFAVEVIGAFYAWHDRLLEELAAADGPALDRLEQYFATLLERARESDPGERGCLLAMLALEKSATSPPIRNVLAAAFGRWQERLAALLDEAIVRGELDPAEDPERLAGLLLHGWEGALLRARLERDVAPLEDFLELGLPRLLGR